MKKTFHITVLFMLAIGLPMAGFAKSQQERGQHGPPPEAIEACEGKSEGDVVSFTGREGETLEGTCEIIENQLVAVPEGGGHPQRDEKQ